MEQEKAEFSEEEPVVSETSSDPVQIRAFTVKADRLVCDLVIPNKRFRYTSPKLAAFAVGQYPDLPQHACVNEIGPSFEAVMESTSTPHLLEHIVISLQTRLCTAQVTPFVGTTEWTDEDAGEAHVEVSFHDDLEALRAFGEATRFLNIAVLTCLA